jgi:hypothetical protein
MVEADHDLGERYAAWWTPIYAYHQLPQFWAEATKARWIAERLRGGQIRAMANAYQRKGATSATIQFVILKPDLWKDWPCMADPDFWANGDVTLSNFRTPAGATTATFFSVRLEPEGFSELPPMQASAPKEDEAADPKLLVDAAVATVLEHRAGQKQTVGKLDPLSISDAEKFCRFILEVRPEISERNAHQRAVQVFPDRKVPRDWFWEIFRSIRGPKNPGRVPKYR